LLEPKPSLCLSGHPLNGFGRPDHHSEKLIDGLSIETGKNSVDVFHVPLKYSSEWA
jgi:hypothetical protein